MDFENDLKAGEMFTFKRNYDSFQVPVSDYDGSVVIGFNEGVFQTVLGHFLNYYIELNLNGFSAEDSPIETAAQIMDIISVKIK